MKIEEVFMSDGSGHSNVTVAICTRNRGERIVATVKTILANAFPSFELLIIDQSTDNCTYQALCSSFDDPRIRYVHSNQFGTGRSRSQALREARGEIVLYTDDDCYVPGDWIEKMVAVFQKDPRISVVFCNVAPIPHDPQTGFVPCYLRDKDKLARSIWEKLDVRGIGAGMGLRRKELLEIGGFDPMLGPGTSFPAAEESDITLRAILKNQWVYETTSVVVTHDGFRAYPQGKKLVLNYWIAIGASLAKPLRAGYWNALPVIFYEAFYLILIQPLLRIFKFQKPRGMRSFFSFWKGFFSGLRLPIDRETILYQDTLNSS